LTPTGGHSLAGGASVTFRLMAFEGKLTGGGLVTLTGKLPTAAMSLLEIVAVSFVELMNVVGRAMPFHVTVAPFAKPTPVTVSVKFGSPTTAVRGARLVTAGVTRTLLALETRLVGVGFSTVTGYDPTLAMSPDFIDAVSLVAFTKVVDLLLPFQRTLEPLTKPVPFTVNVKLLPPTLTALGETLVMEGLTLRLLAAEAPPP